MPEQEKKTRRCSYCNFLGHTRRSCLVLKAGQGSQTKKSSFPKHKNTNGRNVFVQSFGDRQGSPHLVDLRLDNHHALHNVEPYMETPAVNTPRRVTVDFAVAVRKATPIPTPPPSKKERHQWHFSLPVLRFPSLPRLRTAFVVLLLLVSPVPVFTYYQELRETGTMVMNTGAEGFIALHASTIAALQSDIGVAKSDLTRALGAFASAEHILDTKHPIFFSILGMLPIIGADIESGEHLLGAGHHIALGNTYILKGVTDANGDSSLSLIERFDVLYTYLPSVLAEYQAALRELRRVDTATIPTEHQASFEEFRLLFSTLARDIEDTTELLGAVRAVIGGDSFKRYLVVFQNHHERRPTGGFIGSFALVDVQKGKIVHVEVPSGGSYDVKGQLTEYVRPPLPLQLVNGRWEFQDANWFPDFAASAEKLEWFFEHSRHTTIDGVIAVNGTVLERLLRVLGPLVADDRAMTFESTTALATLQKEVESVEGDKPKAIIGSLIISLLERSGNIGRVDAMKLLVEAREALVQKEIQVYMDDPAVHQVFQQYGWTGEIARVEKNQDYLEVVVTNLQGQKSDAKIREDIEHQAVIDEEGNIVDTVVIHRTHEGAPGEMFYGAPNVSYVRVYVPEGAVLLDAGGFTYPPEEAFHVPESWYGEDADVRRLEQSESVHAKSGTEVGREFGKTVFGNWVKTNPGETSSIYFTYRLPFRAGKEKRLGERDTEWHAALMPFEQREFSRYTLLAQKQSGSSALLTSSIIYPTSWLPVWKSHDEMDLAMNGGTLRVPFETDMVIGVLMEKSN